MNNGRHIGLSLQHEYEEKEHRRFMAAQQAMQANPAPKEPPDPPPPDPYPSNLVSWVLALIGCVTLLIIGANVGLWVILWLEGRG